MAMSRAGTISSAALALSGIGMALQPRQAASALGLSINSPRGTAETRIGLGGTFAALGLIAWARGSAETYTAVGATWLGAAVTRLVSLRVDEPETDWTFWAFLAGEVGLGLAGVIAGSRSSTP